MQVNRARAVAAVFAIATIFSATSLAVGVAQARRRAAATAAGARSNDLQRSVEVFGYNAAAKSGATRGEVIYYYKCWNCHNDYTRAAGSPAPTLKGVFSRTTLVTGDPVNDENVAKQIRNGSPQMPSFGTTLKDADIADLLAYLHNGCCYEETNPPVNPWYRANAQNSPAMPARGNLRGGPKRHRARGRAATALEGIMVQLIAPNAVRTTVTTNQDGQYEFPQLLPGSYTLRIAKPLQFLPYQRDAREGRRRRPSSTTSCCSAAPTTISFPPPPTSCRSSPGAEWLWNLPGTAEEKQTFSRTCGEGCHGYEQIMRNQLDERSWRLMVFRMLHYSGSPLIVRGRQRGNLDAGGDDHQMAGAGARAGQPAGTAARCFRARRLRATDVVVTEYELPHVLLTAA